MAIKIIKHGTKRTIECQECGCLFEYEKEDVIVEQQRFNQYVHYIDCPDCRRRLIICHFE